jgi:hypothetical protein
MTPDEKLQALRAKEAKLVRKLRGINAELRDIDTELAALNRAPIDALIAKGVDPAAAAAVVRIRYRGWGD